MPREKVVKDVGREFHLYNDEERTLLTQLRKKSIYVLENLEYHRIKAFVHGSLARGDVNSSSDIDIHIPIQIPSFKLDLIDDFKFASRRIMMGTPNSTIRGLLSVSDNLTVSFPLSAPTEREDEFYLFSGLLYLEDLRLNKRIAGVTKQLLLIEPEKDGYWFSSLEANKKKAIQLLSISQRMIDERIRVLSRRDKIGRTGILIDYSLNPEENFEHALKNLADNNIIVRRMLKRR